jgi:hypothetical protein
MLVIYLAPLTRGILFSPTSTSHAKAVLRPHAIGLN